MEKILLDTDIGTDIDDSICLAYLLCHSECELLGITTVSGEPQRRAQIAAAVCAAAGKSVPIHSGTEAPLLTTQLQPKAQQADTLDEKFASLSFEQNNAIEFMRDTIRQNPNEVTLLAIGPLTNVALLFMTYSDTASLLKSVVLMSGNFYNTAAEWNVRCDPFASKAVYDNKDIKELYAVGLDVTRKVTLDAAETRRRFTSPVLAPITPYIDKWDKCAGTITFHDPLAGACIFDDSICGFERGTVEVETANERCGGITYFTPSENGRHYVANAVDRERFLENYFNVVK